MGRREGMGSAMDTGHGTLIEKNTRANSSESWPLATEETVSWFPVPVSQLMPHSLFLYQHFPSVLAILNVLQN